MQAAFSRRVLKDGLTQTQRLAEAEHVLNEFGQCVIPSTHRLHIPTHSYVPSLSTTTVTHPYRYNLSMHPSDSTFPIVKSLSTHCLTPLTHPLIPLYEPGVIGEKRNDWLESLRDYQ